MTTLTSNRQVTWNQIPQGVNNHLIRSMSRYINKCATTIVVDNFFSIFNNLF